MPLLFQALADSAGSGLNDQMGGRAAVGLGEQIVGQENLCVLIAQTVTQLIGGAVEQGVLV